MAVSNRRLYSSGYNPVIYVKGDYYGTEVTISEITDNYLFCQTNADTDNATGEIVLINPDDMEIIALAILAGKYSITPIKDEPIGHCYMCGSNIDLANRASGSVQFSYGTFPIGYCCAAAD
jgi:hypothetical protein